jgi:hypothetical protein
MATGETEDWCVAAIETVDSFLVPHRRWYHWFFRWRLGVFFFAPIYLYILLPLIYLYILLPFIPRDRAVNEVLIIACVAVLVGVPVLYSQEACSCQSRFYDYPVKNNLYRAM